MCVTKDHKSTGLVLKTRQTYPLFQSFILIINIMLSIVKSKKAIHRWPS
jgi:hypothetical protein